jgi:SagB-type dehydrogenase family enzyme|nr:SagB/ThcOx family dehydrogenase [Candidatus Krumholzibacteria bacterium]
MDQEKRETVHSYHQQTKHHFSRYARSLGFMDWSTQPAPFRRFEGTEVFPLVLPDDSPDAPAGPDWDRLFAAPLAPQSLNQATLSRFFSLSLALSAWKQVISPEGEIVSRWALRVNPSSGNLHPTEGYLVTPGVEGLEAGPGVFHYAPDDHLLEKRGALAPEAVDLLGQALPAGSFLIGLTSIHWREAWKYGERAFRYCQHDVGHALAALSLAAACLGWRARLVEDINPEFLAHLLGTDTQDGPEKEQADCLLLIGADLDLKSTLEQVGTDLEMLGQPNTLSSSHQDWPVIQEVAAATEQAVVAGPVPPPAPHLPTGPSRHRDAHRLIRGRRSAVNMDRKTHLDRDSFFRIMHRALPHQQTPFDTLACEPDVSLVLFIHRVDGLDPGLYVLVRHPDHENSLRSCIRPEFSWRKPEAIPENLPLYQWASGDVTRPARQLSCNQAIAGEGVFSLGMLARFGPTLAQHGPGYYRQLFWETGTIGQILYLEAEAAGLRGTGIGCYFDDEFHKLLGLQDDTWQSLYHFTVGGPLGDNRLQTVGAYDHLKR